jgi:hypothetical protein
MSNMDVGSSLRWLSVSDAPVEEWIGGWKVAKKRYIEVKYVAAKQRSDLF